MIPAKYLLTLVLLLLISWFSSLFFIKNDMQSSNLADITTAINYFHMQDFKAAAQSFAQFQGYEAVTGQAFSHYKLKNYSSARTLFLRSFGLATEDTQRYSALYNAATTAFDEGDYEISYQYFSDASRYTDTPSLSLRYGQLSLALHRLVLKDIQEREENNAKRAGSGKKLAGLDQLEFNTEAEVQFEDNAEPGELIESLDNIQGVELDRLIKKGLNAISLADNNMTNIHSSSSLSNVNGTAGTAFQQNNQLWRRLFEQEHGIPAPIQKKIDIESVKPW